MTIALADAVRWLEDHVLDVDRRAQTCALRPTAPETLRRFFSYIEQVLGGRAGGSRTAWMQVELFEGVPWTSSAIWVRAPPHFCATPSGPSNRTTGGSAAGPMPIADPACGRARADDRYG
jgi:hypothetical protein